MPKHINFENRIKAHDRATAAMDNALKQGHKPEDANRAFHAEITKAIYREEIALNF